MRKEVGSAGKTNQKLPRIEFTFDYHLKLPTHVQVSPDRETHVKTCQSLPFPINNHKYSSKTNVTGICGSQI